MPKEIISFEDFQKVDIRIGTIIDVKDFTKARIPVYQLKIDFGKLGVKQSSALLILYILYYQEVINAVDNRVDILIVNKFFPYQGST